MKKISCAKMGAPCDWSCTAANEEELMNKCLQHAKEAHPDMKMPESDMKEMVKKHMEDA